MKNKSKKLDRKFIPLSIADSLKTINRKFLYKFGKLEFIIHTKWGDIVGEFFVNHSEPQKISSIASSTNEEGDTIYDRFLHVNVSPAAAIEFQHFQDKIIEKINSYFGFQAIKGIKIHQQFLKNKTLETTSTKTVNLIKQEEERMKIVNSTPSLSNKDLEESIVKLGISITNEEE